MSKKIWKKLRTLKKTFEQKCLDALKIKENRDFDSINLYFEDESRFGLFTRAGKSLTARGVKPVCDFQQVFKSTYLFGSFSPIDGSHFIQNLAKCTADNFQIYLNNFSLIKPAEFKVIVLDILRIFSVLPVIMSQVCIKSSQKVQVLHT